MRHRGCCGRTEFRTPGGTCISALASDSPLLNTGFGADSDRDALESLISDGTADAVTVGRPYISNPDLVERWTRGAELNDNDQATWYGGGAQGYTDYPTLAQVDA